VTVPRAEDVPTLSVREAAPLLGFSAATLYRAIVEGRSPVDAIKCGSRVVIPTADLRRVLHLDPLPTNGHGPGTAVSARPEPGGAHATG
jgi:excisionase family DNA binding protein